MTRADIENQGSDGGLSKGSMPGRLFWLLPLVFVIHDAEELVTMPAWLVEHRAMLDSFAQKGSLAGTVVAAAPTTTARAAFAIGLVLAILLLATAGAAFTRSKVWFYAYTGLLGQSPGRDGRVRGSRQRRGSRSASHPAPPGPERISRRGRRGVGDRWRGDAGCLRDSVRNARVPASA